MRTQYHFKYQRNNVSDMLKLCYYATRRLEVVNIKFGVGIRLIIMRYTPHRVLLSIANNQIILHSSVGQKKPL
jgi:hypothetical protein